jgi:hypothetical protein
MKLTNCLKREGNGLTNHAQVVVELDLLLLNALVAVRKLSLIVTN